MKHKILNWLLPALLGVLGSLDLFFGLVDKFLVEFGLPHKYSVAFQIVALLCSLAITKKQPPSLKAKNKTL